MFYRTSNLRGWVEQNGRLELWSPMGCIAVVQYHERKWKVTIQGEKVWEVTHGVDASKAHARRNVERFMRARGIWPWDGPTPNGTLPSDARIRTGTGGNHGQTS